MTKVLFFLLVSLLWGWAGIRIYQNERSRKREMELKAAIKLALESGIDLERGSVHLYQRGNTYNLLKFAPKGHVDEVLTNFDQAADRFIELAAIKAA